MRVAVVGASSLIAHALQGAGGTGGWRFLSHQQALADSAWLHDASVVLNCAFDPRLKGGAYDAGADVDLRLARELPPRVHYLMLSSRLAYGPAGADARLHESRDAAPDRPYGINKLRTERALLALLRERLTVLRLSNVFGDEAQPGRQNFFAIALRSLRERGRIELDMSPFVERDFVPVDDLAPMLVRVASRPRPGLFNLGAGAGTATGRIAQWLIEGHGGGELRVTDTREHDAFWLDTSAAQQAFGVAPVPSERIRRACHALGQRVAATTVQAA